MCEKSHGIRRYMLCDALNLFVSFNAQKIGYLDWHRFYLLVNLSTMSKWIKHIQYSISLSISFENKLKTGVHDLRVNITMFITFLVKGFNDYLSYHHILSFSIYILSGHWRSFMGIFIFNHVQFLKSCQDFFFSKS